MTNQEKSIYGDICSVFAKPVPLTPEAAAPLKDAIRILAELIPRMDEGELKKVINLIDTKVSAIEYKCQQQEDAIMNYTTKPEDSPEFFDQRIFNQWVAKYTANRRIFDELISMLSKPKELGGEPVEEIPTIDKKTDGLRDIAADRLVFLLTEKVQNNPDMTKARLINNISKMLDDEKRTEEEKKEIEAKANVIGAVKNLTFDNTQSTTVQTDNPTTKAKNYDIIVNSIKFIVEVVMGLTPKEYDSIYSNKLNKQARIEYAIRKVVDGADMSINKRTLFVSKQTLFAIVWPDYFKAHYAKPHPWQIFNADGEIKSGFIRAGKPRNDKDPEEGVGRDELLNGDFSNRQRRRTAMNHGDEVDQMLYWAMSEMFSKIEIPTKQLFLSLANPKAYGWNKYGFVKILEARKCYPSPLDFYFLNSPKDFQEEYVYDYYDAREEAGLPKEPALEMLMRAYEHSQYGYRGKEGPDLEK